MGLAVSAQAVDKEALDKRLRLLGASLEELQAKPEKAVPADKLRQACGIILMHHSKGGLVFGYQGGFGAAMIKDAKTGAWSAPAFLKSSEGSFGLQIGGQTSFSVILLMNTNAFGLVTGMSSNFGGEASGTAGNASGKEASTTSTVEPLTLVYTDVSGLYGGATVKGGSLEPDTEANQVYYGEFLASKDILLDKKGKPTEASKALAEKINGFAKEATH
jgi:lipid-binding SYLF domain-containing protein